MSPRFCACVLLAISCASCNGPHRTTVEFYIVDGYRFTQTERDTIQEIADQTALEVDQLLPALPTPLVLKVQAGKDVSPESGGAGSAVSTNTVYFTVDPNRKEGVVGIAEAYLRPMLFHEFHHLVRLKGEIPPTVMNRVISEGMATVFERDFAGVAVAWGQYPPEVSDWVKELMALPPTTPPDQWMYRHPDGRRWIGLRAGTYLVERAVKASGKSAAELVTMPTDDVLRLALGN